MYLIILSRVSGEKYTPLTIWNIHVHVLTILISSDGLLNTKKEFR